ncbi:MAG: hypothetical protein CMI32_02390 [Opitutales bacterium]|jgi:hypothetical protein|nr:hypothetical protein [Opitutales bacterium]|tara:strand:- start:289 stop:687 length:399 start_codon:yes stop_codon:yes gene_type:complete
MNSHDELDRRINAQLQDKETEPGLDFTARVLERISEDRIENGPKTNYLRPWWFILPMAAAIALALLPLQDEPEDSKAAAQVDNSGAHQQKSSQPTPAPFAEMEELFVMEESLRDFEVLFDDDALQILALLDE